MQLVNTDKVGTACKRAEAQSSKSCMQHAVFEWHCRAVLHTCWKLALPGWCVKPMLVKQPCRSFGNMMLCMQAHDYKDSDASIVNDQAHCTLVKKIQPLIHLQQLCTKLILIHPASSVGCCCLNACPSEKPCSQLKMEDWTVQPASLHTVASPEMSRAALPAGCCAHQPSFLCNLFKDDADHAASATLNIMHIS